MAQEGVQEQQCCMQQQYPSMVSSQHCSTALCVPACRKLHQLRLVCSLVHDLVLLSVPPPCRKRSEPKVLEMKLLEHGKEKVMNCRDGKETKLSPRL